MLKLDPQQVQGSKWDEGGKSEIVQILVSHDETIIRSMQSVYVEKGEVYHSEVHGKPNGLKFNIVTFDYPSEFLTSVSGVYDYEGLVAVAFGSNKCMYGPFGKISVGAAPEYQHSDYASHKFNYEFGLRSCFAGFHGSVRYSCVNGIGIYIKPIESLAELRPITSLVELEPNESLVELNPTESLAELNIK